MYKISYTVTDSGRGHILFCNIDYLNNYANIERMKIILLSEILSMETDDHPERNQETYIFF
jgi:hypothetical protein